MISEFTMTHIFANESQYSSRTVFTGNNRNKRSDKKDKCKKVDMKGMRKPRRGSKEKEEERERKQFTNIIFISFSCPLLRM